MAANLLPGQKRVLDETEKTEADVNAQKPNAAGGGGNEPVYTASGGSAPKTTKPSPIKGSGYTNIQKIMSASGAGAGPTRLAGAVVGGIGASTAGAAGALKGAKQEFGSKIEESSKDVSGRLKAGESAISGALQGITPDVQGFQTATSGTYQAPEFQMSPEARRRTAESAALAQLAGQSGGRGAILQRYVRAPQYNLGQQRMDQLLLGKGGSAAIRGALRQGARLEADVGRQEAVAKEQAKQLQSQAAGIAQQLKTQLGTTTEGFKKQLSDQETQKEKEIIDAYNRVYSVINMDMQSPSSLLSRFGSLVAENVTGKPIATALNAISRKDLKLLGLKESDIANLSKALNVSDYFTNKTDLEQLLNETNKEAYATNENIAAAKALGLLSGEADLGLTGLGSAVDKKFTEFKASDYSNTLNDMKNKFRNSASDPIYDYIIKQDGDWTKGYSNRVIVDAQSAIHQMRGNSFLQNVNTAKASVAAAQKLYEDTLYAYEHGSSSPASVGMGNVNQRDVDAAQYDMYVAYAILDALNEGNALLETKTNEAFAPRKFTFID